MPVQPRIKPGGSQNSVINTRTDMLDRAVKPNKTRVKFRKIVQTGEKKGSDLEHVRVGFHDNS